MPLIEDKNQQKAFARFIGQEESVADEADFGELINAAFRTENSLGSIIASENGLPNNIVDNVKFNPLNYLTENELIDEKFMDNVYLADNEMEINAVRKQQAREVKDRRLLAENGANSFFAQFIAGVLDPINLIPVGGTAYKTYRAGGSILKSAIATGSVAAGSQAAVESLLLKSQIERTYGESAVNVTAGFLLGGVIGATPTALKKIFSDNPKLEREVLSSMDPEAKLSRGENPILDIEESKLAEDNTQGKSVGAAAVKNKDIRVKGVVARFLTKFLGFDPLSRTITSSVDEVRVLANELAENPIAMESNGNKFVANSAEQKAKLKDGLYIDALTSHSEVFKLYQKNGGELSKVEFNEAVSKQLRNNKSTDDFVIKSAKAWRDKLYEPIKKELIDAELLPEGIEVSTALNYLNRVWNKEKLTANLDEFVAITSKWLKDQSMNSARKIKNEAKRKLATRKAEPLNFDEAALDIYNRIQGSQFGKLDIDFPIGLKGPLKDRVFNIPDELIEQFLDNNIEDLGARYLKQLAIDIELKNAFGSIDLSEQLVEIGRVFDVKIAVASRTDKKLALKIGKEKKQALSDIEAMRDRLRGTYDIGDPDSIWRRIGRSSRDLNYLRFMGGVTASSLPDVARIVMSKGIVNVFKDGLVPLIKANKAFKISADEAKRWGIGTDMLAGSRAEVLADVADYAKGGTKVERGLRAAAQNFGKFNLMDRWMASVKQLYAVVSQTDMANMFLLGEYKENLGQLGISKQSSVEIAGQLKKYGEKIDGVFVANTRKWDDQDLAKIWGGALRKEVDRVIVTPGQEKPLFMSSEMGKVIFQFRSFMFSATQRVLISGIQRQDEHYIQGILGMTSLGVMAYMFKQWDAGREISSDPLTLVMEGIDRSGTLGLIMEANNTIEKLSRQNYGLRPLLGVTSPASRFASRSQAESFLGPSFGSLLSTTLNVTGGLSDGEVDQQDTRALRRLIPYQNLMVFRQFVDKAEQSIKN